MAFAAAIATGVAFDAALDFSDNGKIDGSRGAGFAHAIGGLLSQKPEEPETSVDQADGNQAKSGEPRGLSDDEIGQMSEAGKQPDRNGLTQAGRAGQKHSEEQGKRTGSAFPGTEDKTAEGRNEYGQRELDSILNDPGATVVENERGQKTVTDSKGRQAVFTKEGKFIGFRDPNYGNTANKSEAQQSKETRD